MFETPLQPILEGAQAILKPLVPALVELYRNHPAESAVFTLGTVAVSFPVLRLGLRLVRWVWRWAIDAFM